MAEVHRFSLDLEAFARKANARIDEVVHNVALGMFSSVILRSPVLSGRFRANWQVFIGPQPPAPTVLDAVDPDGEGAIEQARAVLAQLLAHKTKGRLNAAIDTGDGDSTRIWLVNNLPYARRLEHGWSQKQAPNGMVGRTVAEYQRFISQAVKG